MKFQPRPLDSTIVFEEVHKNRFTVIEGNGQQIYWKGSNVTVYERDHLGKEQPTPLHNWPEGQGEVPLGTNLYITEGSVKQV